MASRRALQSILSEMPSTTGQNDVNDIGETVDNHPPERGDSSSQNREAQLPSHELQSDEQAQFLNAIDGLRREHIDADISIPQIVVCGNQSSGKSSVLEAISRVPFPIGSRTTTRFATEISLRHSTNAGIRVQIIASPDRSEQRKTEIESFQLPFELSCRSDFGRAIQAAGDHLRSLEPEKRFWSDLLRAEISGPDQPHLTLVDIPGIIQSEDGTYALSGDKAKIKSVISEYIRNERTTILAVVDAQNDLANQEIFDIIRAEGSAMNRTLGIITKPDLPPNGSDVQRNVITLARNEEVHLTLGWHVLKNLPHEQFNRTFAERDAAEGDFFDSSPWDRLSKDDTGIDKLRKKLRHELFETTIHDLPSLMTEMRRKLDRCNSALDLLGPGRETIAEQRAYLTDVLDKLQRLIETALKGDYENTEFAAFFNGTHQRGLRDHINALTAAFAKTMAKHGKQYHVYTDELQEGEQQRRASLDSLGTSEEPNFFPPYVQVGASRRNDAGRAVNVSMRKYCDVLARYMNRTRGQNLPGIHSTSTVKAVFRQQSLRWSDYALGFGDQCCTATYNFLSAALLHVAGYYTAEALSREYVRHVPTVKRRQLDEKINELLWPFKESHLITYNPNYAAETRSGSAPTPDSAVRRFGQIARVNNFSATMVSAADAMDDAEAFYKISLHRFVDEVATLGVERCLLHDLSSIIPTREASTMRDEKVSRIAAEPPESRRDRVKVQAQVAALEDAIRVFQTYSDGYPELTVPQINAAATTSLEEASEAQPASGDESAFSNVAHQASQPAINLAPASATTPAVVWLNASAPSPQGPTSSDGSAQTFSQASALQPPTGRATTNNHPIRAASPRPRPQSGSGSASGTATNPPAAQIGSNGAANANPTPLPSVFSTTANNNAAGQTSGSLFQPATSGNVVLASTATPAPAPIPTTAPASTGFSFNQPINGNGFANGWTFGSTANQEATRPVNFSL